MVLIIIQLYRNVLVALTHVLHALRLPQHVSHVVQIELSPMFHVIAFLSIMIMVLTVFVQHVIILAKHVMGWPLQIV